jgi:hypothetical protein
MSVYMKLHNSRKSCRCCMGSTGLDSYLLRVVGGRKIHPLRTEIDVADYE